MTTQKQKDIWQEIDIKERIIYHYQIGPLDLWINRVENEWQMAFEHENGSQERAEISETATAPINLKWYRWILDKRFHKLKITPIMPDRPVIVRPEVPVSIMPGQTAVFFVAIPMFIKVSVGNQSTILCEEPTLFLSNTWFGDAAQGELCYALKTTAKLNPDHLDPHHYRVVCPMEITNKCHEQLLDSHRLCLRVRYLNIYHGATRLWGNTSKVTFYGTDQLSKITYDPKIHEFDGEKVLIGNARNTQTKNLLFKTFDHLSSFRI